MSVVRFGLPWDGWGAARVCVGVPVPVGGAERVRVVAARAVAVAVELGRVEGQLRAVGVSVGWGGSAGRACGQRLGRGAPDLAATAARYAGYGAALRGYADSVEVAVPRLAGLRAQLLAGLAAAPGSTAGLTAGSTAGVGVAGLLTGPPVGAVTGPTLAGTSAAGAAGEELLAVARRFQRAYDEWADAVERCGRALRQVNDTDPGRDRHGFAAVSAAVTSDLPAVLAYASPALWLLAHPSLRNLSQTLGRLSSELTVLGIAFSVLCPPAGAACLTTATILAAAQLATDATRRSRGEQLPTSTLALDAVSAIPIAGTLGKELKIVSMGLETETVTRLVPGGSLVAHEAMSSGHTLERHVGHGHDFLVARLAKNPHIKGASAFYDRAIAENAITRVLAAHDEEITRWLSGPRGVGFLRARASTPLGRYLKRGAKEMRDVSGIRMIMQSNDELDTGYSIITSYLEP